MSAKGNFKKAVAAAKKLYKTGKYKKFSDAVRAAYKTIGSAKSSDRQTGSSNKKRDKARKAKAPGKRIVKHSGAKSTVYYERRKNRSDKPGTLSGHKSAILAILKDRLKNFLYLKETASLKSTKKFYRNQIRDVKRQIKNLK